MNEIGGYAGNILYVDLSSRSATGKPLSEDMMRELLGGQGINAGLAYELIKPKEDPFSSGNVLLFGAGPFVGTIIPGSGKCNVMGKSPAAGFLGSSGTGHFGMLKFSGYDNLVITGKADHPVYIKIHDDEVQIRDADHIWGKDLWEATEVIWDEVGDVYTVACIGPAGENLVRDASILVDKYSAFARTGLGAVMGSKNLKAIAVSGTRDVRVADPARFETLAGELYRDVMVFGNLQNRRVYGTMAQMEYSFKTGETPYKNFKESAPEEMLEVFDLNFFLEKMKDGDIACMGCPIGCKHSFHIKEGKYEKSEAILSCFHLPTSYFGGNCAIEDWLEVFKCAELGNRLGLDWTSTSGLIAFAIELYEREIINRQDTGGLELSWGSAETIRELMRQIGYREGFGKILAEGFLGAPRQIGRRSEDYALHVKGVGVYIDPRPMPTSPTTLCHITSVKGHATFYNVPPLKKPDHAERICRRIGMPERVINEVVKNPEGNVGRVTKWLEDYNETMEALGLCQHPPFVRFSIDIWAEIYSALTGIPMKPEDLLNAAAKTWDLKRAFNLREGASRKDDAMPGRFMVEPLKVGDKMHDAWDQRYVDEMITQYYEERGWDPKEGTPDAGGVR